MATTINLNGREIKLTSKYQGTAYPFGDKYEKNHYRVCVTIDGEKFQFNYYSSELAPLNRDGLINALHCFALDACAYDDAQDILDFKDNFGFKDNKECRRAFDWCKKSYEKLSRFSLDAWQLCDYLQEMFNL